MKQFLWSGPLVVDDITKSSCKLSWKAPEDDGGKPITGYIVEKMDKASGRWVPVSRTEPNVTECPVKGLQEGHEYMFRVKAVNDEGESEPLESDAAIQAKDPYGETGRVRSRVAAAACRKQIKKNILQVILVLHAISLKCWTKAKMKKSEFIICERAN